MAKRKVRDIYGNWINVDDDEEEDEKTESASSDRPNGDSPKLEWKDWIAVVIASLETILLPVIVFIIVLFVLVVFLFHV